MTIKPLLFLILFPVTVLGQTNFREHLNTPFIGVNRSAVDAADVDGDGDLDIIIIGKTNTGYSLTQLYLNDGYGNYQIDQKNLFPHISRGFIKFSDIDNDNDMDVLMGGYDDTDSAYINFYLNNGNGIFTLKPQTSIINYIYGHGIFGDIDGDHDEDLLVTGFDNYPGTKTALLYLNDGAGNFILQPGQNFATPSNQSTKLLDIDNDNDLDIFICDQTQHHSIIYLNDGLGNFSENLNTGIPYQSYSTYEFSDVNNDNLPDVFISKSGSSYNFIQLFINSDSLQFNLTPESIYGYSYCELISFDMNNDNIPDLYVNGDYRPYRDYNTELYLISSNLFFSLDNQLIIPVISYGSTLPLDVDNDGDLDLFICGIENQKFVSKLFINDVIISTNSIDKETDAPKLYPNPSTGHLNIDFSKKYDLKVFTITGQLVYNQENIQPTSTQFQLDVEKGIYIIEIQSGTDKHQFKMVIN